MATARKSPAAYSSIGEWYAEQMTEMLANPELAREKSKQWRARSKGGKNRWAGGRIDASVVQEITVLIERDCNSKLPRRFIVGKIIKKYCGRDASGKPNKLFQKLSPATMRTIANAGIDFAYGPEPAKARKK